MDVRDRDLRRRDQEIVHLVDPEEVLLELGQLARSRHALPVDHERGEHLGVTVFARVEIEHEIDESPAPAWPRAPDRG